jgi:MFS family permease
MIPRNGRRYRRRRMFVTVLLSMWLSCFAFALLYNLIPAIRFLKDVELDGRDKALFSAIFILTGLVYLSLVAPMEAAGILTDRKEEE